jgi:Ribonuclease G/E
MNTQEIDRIVFEQVENLAGHGDLYRSVLLKATSRRGVEKDDAIVALDRLDRIGLVELDRYRKRGAMKEIVRIPRKKPT